MSNEDINVAKVIDSRLETRQTNLFVTPISVDTTTKHTYKADTCNSTHLKWNAISTPGGSYFINDRWYVRAKFRFNIKYHMNEGKAPRFIAREGQFGLRFLPITSCTHHISLMINGSQEIQTYPREFIHAIAQYHEQADYKELYSCAPHRKCRVQEFCDAIGTNYNSLSSQGDYDDDTGNGYIPEMEITKNNLSDTQETGTPCEFEFTTYLMEPVYAEPLRFDSNRGNGNSIWRLNQFTLDYHLTSLPRMLCIDTEEDAFLIDKIDVTPEEAYLLLDISSVPPQIVPSIWKKGLRERHVDRVHIGEVQPGEIKTVISPVINLLNYPQRIFVFVREDLEEYVHNDTACVKSTDTFAQILNVEMEMMNQRNILRDHHPIDLYRIAMNNGLKNTTFLDLGTVHEGFDFNEEDPTKFAREIGKIGSVLCFTVNSDILVPDKMLIPNTAMDSRNFMIRATFRNINMHRPLNMSLYLVFESYGTITISDRFVEINRIPVDAEQVISAPQVTADGGEKENGHGLWAAGMDEGGLIGGGVSKLGKVLGVANTVTGIAKTVTGAADSAVRGLRKQFGGGGGGNPAFAAMMEQDPTFDAMNVEAGQALYGPDLGISPY